MSDTKRLDHSREKEVRGSSTAAEGRSHFSITWKLERFTGADDAEAKWEDGPACREHLGNEQSSDWSAVALRASEEWTMHGESIGHKPTKLSNKPRARRKRDAPPSPTLGTMKLSVLCFWTLPQRSIRGPPWRVLHKGAPFTCKHCFEQLCFQTLTVYSISWQVFPLHFTF